MNKTSSMAVAPASSKPLWPGRWPEVGARMLRRDLEAAREAWIEEAKDPAERQRRSECKDFLRYENEAGEVFDFHAQRSQFGTNLERHGVSLTAAQKLMRHSDPKLTASVYGHLEADDLRDAVESLPPLRPTANQDTAASG